MIAALLGSFLDHDFAGSPLRAWMYALIAFAVTLLVLTVVKQLVELRLAKHAEQTETDLDDLVVDLVRRTKRFFLVALGVFFAHAWLSLSDGAQLWVQRGVQVALWIQVGLWALGLVQFGLKRMVRGRAAEDPARTMGTSVLGFLGRAFVWTMVFL